MADYLPRSRRSPAHAFPNRVSQRLPSPPARGRMMALVVVRTQPRPPSGAGLFFDIVSIPCSPYHVLFRSGHPEFLSGSLHRFVLVFSLDDTEVLVLGTKLHTPMIH